MKPRILLATVLATATASVLADYTITSNTTYGDGSEVTWGSAPFTGNFLFDFTGGGDSITFYNPIQLDGNNVEFYVPVGKTVTLAGGVSNPTASKSDTSGGQIKLTEQENRGTLVVNGLDKTRLGVKWGTMVVKGDPNVTKTLNYCYVWNWGNLVFDGGEYDCYGQIALDGNSISATNCTFHKVQNSSRDGSINASHGTFRLKDCTIDSINNCVLRIGGIYSSQTSHNGVFDWDGGTLGMGGGIIVGGTGTGTFNLKAGLVKSWEIYQDWPQIVGNNATGVGNVNISGGEWQVQGSIWGSEPDNRTAIYVGNNGTGTVTVSGTGVFSLYPRSISDSKNSKAQLVLAKNAGSIGTFNLNEGGTFRTYGRGAIGGEGTSRFVFNGGTFQKPSEAPGSYNFIETNVTTVAVAPKGGVVDTGKHSLKFCDPIVDLDATATPEGFFTKRGTGTLTFHGANTYSAPTRVSEGTIALADNGALSPNSQLWVDSGITVNLAGSAAQTVGGLAGKGTISNVSLTNTGAICPGGTNEVGTLTLSNCPLTLAAGSCLVIDVDAQGNCDTLVITGTSSPLNLSDIVIEVTGAGATADAIGPIIQCAAGVIGEPRRVIGTKCIAVTADASGNVRLSKPGTTLFIR